MKTKIVMLLLPDANADYWYWIKATRQDGLVISKGPIRAEFGVK